MRITTVLRAATVALAVLAVAAPSIAQEDPGSPRVLNRDPIIVKLEFGGGSLESFVKALRKAASDNPMNIVFSPEAASLPVAPITLQQVDTYTALRSVSELMKVTPMLGEDRRSIALDIGRIAGNGAPVYSIEVYDARQQQQMRTHRSGAIVPAAELHTAVHSITELTTGSGAMSADDVLSAIQAALAIEGPDDETKIRYHEETGLIFARVTPDQGSVIELTLMNLERSQHARQRSDSKSEAETIYQMTGTRNVDELVTRVRSADGLRGRVLELQQTIAELQTHIINLQGELDRRRDGDGEDRD